MIIIAFDEGNQWVGGYGDRIVGLMSCRAIAELMGREFRIHWTKENIEPYFDYTKYKYDNQKNTNPIIYDLIDNKTKTDYFIMSPRILPEPVIKFYLNHDICQYIYKNTAFSDKHYEADMFRFYKTLYTDIFIPTKIIQDKINELISPENQIPIVGIQIRAGDIYIQGIWGNSYKVLDSPEKTIPDILQKIKAHLELSFTEYKVFLTSDYNEIYRLAVQIWNPEQLVYLNSLVQHMDRNPSGDFSKIFVDNYILSQKTARLYISDWSNYGRVAALSSVHDNIYNLQCGELNKTGLLSKH